MTDQKNIENQPGETSTQNTSENNQATRYNKSFKVVSIVVLILFVIALGLATYFALPALWDETKREGLQLYIQNLGVWGIFLFLFLQILQIVLFIIPGEVTELIAGAVYGTFGGLALCIIGVILGQMIIFFIVRKLGHQFVTDIAGGKKLERFKFLHSEKQLERITFILYVIVGTPKDLLTYFMPLTPIDPWRFMFISVVARIPGIIVSTYVGKSAAQGDWMLSALVYVALIIVSLGGIYINDRIMKRRQANQADIDAQTEENSD